MTLKDWFDSTFSIEANGFYGSEEARILPYTTTRYSLETPSIVRERFGAYYIDSTSVNVSAEAVANTSIITFDGTEYEEYIHNNNSKQINDEGSAK